MMRLSDCPRPCANQSRTSFSAAPAERRDEKVWMLFEASSQGVAIAENGAILRSFPALRLTGSNSEDCYTFEGLASTPGVIHTTCYYHYKRITFGLKEEA